MKTLLRHATLSLVVLAAAACIDPVDGPDAGTADAGPGSADDDAGTIDDAGPTPDGGPDGGTPPAALCGEALTAADLDEGSWDTRFTVAGFTGHDGIAPAVYDFATDVDGSLIATGRFQWIGDERVLPLARWRDGAWVPARDTWELVPTDDGFSAIAIASTGELALSTADSFGERAGEIWLDDGSGLLSIGAFEGQVRSLAWYDGKLWVAGLFAMEDGAIQGVAVWDGGVWTVPPGGGSDGPAYELTLDGDELLVAGAFAHLGGIEAAGVAAYDGEAWRALDLPGAAVYALARSDEGELYAGGALGELAPGTGGIARWTGTAWEQVGGGLAQGMWPGVVTDLVEHDGALHVTGCFGAAGGPDGSAEALSVGALVRWDGAAWLPPVGGDGPVVGAWFLPAVCGDEGPAAIWDSMYQRLAVNGDHLFVGGMFPGGGGVPSQSILAYGDDDVVPQVTGGLGVNGSIELLAAAGSECAVYGLGTFTHAAGQATSPARLLRFTGDGWQPIAGSVPSMAWCAALAGSPTGEVTVGCLDFDEALARGVGLLYRVVGDALEPVDVDVGPVHGLSYDRDGRLWIVGGEMTGYLARLDGDELTMIEDGFNGVVSRVDVSGDDVLVGGDFTQVGDVAANRVARWDGSAWAPLGDGVPGFVTALARDGERVYASTYQGPDGFFVLGGFDGESWSELASEASGLTPQSYFNFNALRVVEGAVLAVGTAELDGKAGRGALIYEDGTFRPFGGGVHAMFLGGLALTKDAIWVGGGIAEAGEGEELVPTVGVARRVMPVE